MSTSHTNKKYFVVALAVGSLLAVGCGDPAEEPPTTAPTTAGVSAAAGSVEAAPEETDLAPVDLQLAGGGFASDTPRSFHVPSGFLIVVSAKNTDDRTIRLSVTGPSIAQTFKIPAGETQKITIASLAAGEAAKLISGGATIEIVADAEPGP
ncbi:MAG: hypothetical protein JHD02_06545 [Thermoleophilaceae bacterium]|nr:hypothetical protein [Thermoleophilaceae bacterium]